MEQGIVADNNAGTGKADEDDRHVEKRGELQVLSAVADKLRMMHLHSSQSSLI